MPDRGRGAARVKSAGCACRLVSAAHVTDTAGHHRWVTTAVHRELVWGWRRQALSQVGENDAPVFDTGSGTLARGVRRAEAGLATMVLDDPRVRRLLAVPGIGPVAPFGLLAAIGDITRFPRPNKLVSYLGLDPRVRQSGGRPAHIGHISRAGQGYARSLLVEAAHAAIPTPGPSRAFHAKVTARRGADPASPRSRSPASSPSWPGTCSPTRPTAAGRRADGPRASCVISSGPSAPPTAGAGSSEARPVARIRRSSGRRY